MALVSYLQIEGFQAPAVWGNKVQSIDPDNMKRKEMIEAVWDSWPGAYREGGGRKLVYNGDSYIWQDKDKIIKVFRNGHGIAEKINLLFCLKEELIYLHSLIAKASGFEKEVVIDGIKLKINSGNGKVLEASELEIWTLKEQGYLIFDDNTYWLTSELLDRV